MLPSRLRIYMKTAVQLANHEYQLMTNMTQSSASNRLLLHIADVNVALSLTASEQNGCFVHSSNFELKLCKTEGCFCELLKNWLWGQFQTSHQMFAFTNGGYNDGPHPLVPPLTTFDASCLCRQLLRSLSRALDEASTTMAKYPRTIAHL